MRRLTSSIPAAAVLALALTGGGTAGAADHAPLHPPQEGSDRSPQGAATVPDDFSPAATTWTSPRFGWVLGYVPCDEGTCSVLLRTLNGGASWSTLRSPGLAPSEFGNRTHLQATQSWWVTALVASNTEETVVSMSGGESWREVDIPADKVGDLTATTEGIYLTAHATEGDNVTTSLWRSPNALASWEPVEGVAAEVPGNLGSVMSDIAIDPWGVRLVGTSSFDAPTHAWSAPDGDGLEEIEAPCGNLATQFFGFANTEHQYALCSENPGRGAMDKELFLSTDGVTFASVGTLPPRDGITSDFAVADQDTVAIGATGGDAGIVHMTFDGGQTWETPFFEPDTGPVWDLEFQDPDHGVLVTGYPDLGTSAVYQTSDGGHTWERLDF